MVIKERMGYKNHQNKAIKYLDMLFSTIVEGADQSASALSHFITNSKVEQGRALNLRLNGPIEQFQSASLYLYRMTEELKSGTSHIVEKVQRFITDLPATGLFLQTLFV